MITPEKRVSQLGRVAPIPVEVSTFGLIHTELRLIQIGAATEIRRQDDGTPRLTDGGNAIIDCKFPPDPDLVALEARIQCIPGVLETGLFIDLCDTLIVGTGEGVEIIETGVGKGG